MKLCMLCGNPTNGSVGAAGIHWSFICQPCKDDEDKALSDSLKLQAKVTDAVISLLSGGGKK